MQKFEMYPSKNQNPFFTQNQLIKMKNLIVLLLVLGNVGVVSGQYTIMVSPPPSMLVTSYECKIVRDLLNFPNTKWADLDLITWIFPDGQYMKRTIDADAQGNALSGDIVTWWPSAGTQAGAPSGPNDIQAFIAEKGGTGIPPHIVSPIFPYFGSYFNIPPSTFNFPNNNPWQVNRTWDLSPHDESFLLVSYKPFPGCISDSTDFIELRFDKNKLTLGDNYGFNLEDIPQNTNVTDKIIRIKKFAMSPVHKHIFLKVKPTALLELRESINITVNGKFCNFSDSFVLSYVNENVPHDPNKKVVDIEKICLNQFYPLKLTYTVQFQNDGAAPVKEVHVKDLLPSELNPLSFHLISPVPMMNGIDVGFEDPINPSEPNKLIKFTGTGLPGLNQTTPFSYGYDQTIYRFSFDVEISTTIQDTIKNRAEVTFYNNGTPIIPSLATNFAKTFGVDQFPGPDCYYSPTTEALDILGNIYLKPNPFLDQIDISFELLEKSKIEVEVRDIWGKLVETVASDEYPAGAQNITWNGTSLPNGVYLIFFRTEKGFITKKVVKVQ